MLPLGLLSMAGGWTGIVKILAFVAVLGVIAGGVYVVRSAYTDQQKTIAGLRNEIVGYQNQVASLALDVQGLKEKNSALESNIEVLKDAQKEMLEDLEQAKKDQAESDEQLKEIEDKIDQSAGTDMQDRNDPAKEKALLERYNTDSKCFSENWNNLGICKEGKFVGGALQ